MEKERTTGTKIFGWFFIILSFLLLAAFPKIASSYYKLVSINASLLENINFLPKLSVYSMVTTLIGFILFFVTGIGILKVRRWAYYVALFIPFIYFMGIIKNIWFFGLQFIMRPPTFYALFVSVTIMFFLMRKGIIEQFNADYVTPKGKKLNPKKFILRLSIVVILVSAISLGFWILLVNIKFKDQLPIINLKPKKIEYRIEDNNFILNNCQKRDVFGYSVYIPKDLSIGMVSRGSSGIVWSLSFLNVENSSLKSFIMLDSRGFGQLLLPISKALNFKTGYEFEKAVNYSDWMPIYIILKIIGSPKGLESIDEAVTSAWKGFIKVIKNKERNAYEASLYSLKQNQTCNISVLFKDGTITPAQAKSILASVEFKAIGGESKSLFERGRVDLANADFISASINFMNALYMDEQNSEYAYYLARSLFEDNSSSGRKIRLSSSKNLLEYSLKLNPHYQEAKELLALVDNENK